MPPACLSLPPSAAPLTDAAAAVEDQPAYRRRSRRFLYSRKDNKKHDSALSAAPKSPVSFLSETVSSVVSLVPTNAADRELRFVGFYRVFSTGVQRVN